MMRGSKWGRVLLGLAFALTMVAPASAAAMTGSIEGVTIDPSLTHASVQNLSATYDRCASEQAEELECSWTASAMLVPPQWNECPSDGILGLPPGMSPVSPTRVWTQSATTDGSLASGPLTFALDGVNDEHLCLYLNHTTKANGGPAMLASNLLASQLLHVDRPPRDSSAEVETSVLGGIVPTKLPRSRPVPITLRTGFTSETPLTHTAPELTRIAIGVSRNVTFQTAGLPPCPIARLYASAASARQACAGSLVGQGVVDSEVTLPGQPTVPIEGHLLAFYAFAEGQPHILAQITSGAPLPLTYVIPFEIVQRVHGAFGTTLVVRKMHILRGICARGHPNCFAEPYALKGVYSHISKLELSLHRRFAAAGKEESFISADCPARGRQPVASLPFGVSLRYDLGSSLGGESATVLRRCKVAN